MLAKRIIPCLDVTGGRVVKGTNFVDLRDAGDPVEIARRYDEQGADELTFLDITATSDERDLILKVIEDVAAQVFIPLTVGGFTAVRPLWLPLMLSAEATARGRFIPAAAERRQALMRLSGQRKLKSSAPAKFFSPAWTATERKPDLIWN